MKRFGGRSLVAIVVSALAALVCVSASAATIETPFNIFTPVFTLVFNDRIGNSRFFSGANSDLVRVSAFVSPSPDSDSLGVTVGTDLFKSTNGALTGVTVTHPDFGTISPNPRSLTFVGLTSGRGGGRNEFTTTFNRSNSVVASLLDAWDASPFTLTVSNPNAPNGVTSVTYAAPDFDRNAMPAFVTDLTLTGGGLNPKLDWVIPAGGVAPTSVSIQIRRIDAENADRTRITAATLVHVKNLAADATSYTINELFSNSGIPGFPSGLEVNQRYEISVQLDYAVGGILQGRSRTFFEFKPLPSGAGNVSVFLPSVGENGKFKFDIEVKQGEQVAIDPIVAVGYEYQIGTGDPLFASVMLPDIGDGLFDLYLFNGSDWVFQTALAAGTQYFFGGGGVDRFRVLGIESSAGLDPADTTAFVTTLTFAGSGRFTGTMTALTAEVAEPNALLLSLAAFGALALLRRSPIRVHRS